MDLIVLIEICRKIKREDTSSKKKKKRRKVQSVDQISKLEIFLRINSRPPPLSVHQASNCNVTLDHTTSIGNHKAAFALPTVHPNLPNPTFQALSKHLLSYIPNSITMQLLISSIQFKFISLNKQSIKEIRTLIAVVLYWYFLPPQTSKSMLQQWS